MTNEQSELLAALGISAQLYIEQVMQHMQKLGSPDGEYVEKIGGQSLTFGIWKIKDGFWVMPRNPDNEMYDAGSWNKREGVTFNQLNELVRVNMIEKTFDEEVPVN